MSYLEENAGNDENLIFAHLQNLAEKLIYILFVLLLLLIYKFIKTILILRAGFLARSLFVCKLEAFTVEKICDFLFIWPIFSV